MTEEQKPKRRIRYKGTHPRTFQEKYKELNPGDYPEEIKKAMVAGKTPAGSHRPICLSEILEILAPTPGMKVVDATLGYGGHASEFLKRISPDGKLMGFDIDSDELPKTASRLRSEGHSDERFIPILANFSTIPAALKKLGLSKVNLVIADLGVSSMQIDNPERGFSFKTAGPLDLRLNRFEKKSAADYLKSVTKQELIRILEENADEVFGEEIATGILKAQKIKPIKSTDHLSQVVQDTLKLLSPRLQREAGNKPLRRVFQALRIEVNNEFGSLDQFLENLPKILISGGKVAILTFHSGEDRRVKKAFKEGLKSGIYSLVARDVIRPCPDEVRSNPRSSSAKLRWAIKL